jgi:hypothetical protein
MMKNNKWYLTLSSIAFTVIAITHLAIILFPMQAGYYGVSIPLEMNGVAVMLAGYLATRGFMEARKM